MNITPVPSAQTYLALELPPIPPDCNEISSGSLASVNFDEDLIEEPSQPEPLSSLKNYSFPAVSVCAQSCCPGLKLLPGAALSPTLMPYLHSDKVNLTPQNKGLYVDSDPVVFLTPLCQSIVYEKNVEEVSSLWRVNGLVDPRLLLHQSFARPNKWYNGCALGFMVNYDRLDLFNRLISDVFAAHPPTKITSFHAELWKIILQGYYAPLDATDFDRRVENLRLFIVLDGDDDEQHRLYTFCMKQVFSRFVGNYIKKCHLMNVKESKWSTQSSVNQNGGLLSSIELMIRANALGYFGTIDIEIDDLATAASRGELLMKRNVRYESDFSKKDENKGFRPKASDLFLADFAFIKQKEISDFMSSMPNIEQQKKNKKSTDSYCYDDTSEGWNNWPQTETTTEPLASSLSFVDQYCDRSVRPNIDRSFEHIDETIKW